MDATKSLLASLALACCGSYCAAERITDDYQQTLAPAVTTASCTSGCNSCDQSCGTYCDNACISCDGACDGGCDSICGGGNAGLLGFGIIKPSEKCFCDFISPMTNPVFFEDPRNLTEARAIFINHQLPTALGSNSVQVYALQLRAALTDRLSLIATKDGLIYTQSPVLDSGYADLSAGLKYNLYRDPHAGRLLSGGMTFEVPLGSNKSLQGNGNGEFNFFLTGATRIGDKGHWISAAGLREPADTSLENRMFYWSNHLDRQVGDRPLWAFTEVNWYNYQSSATAFPLAVEGGDLFNLGSPGITGNDLVTAAFGAKIKPRNNVEAGLAWEFPLTSRQGLMDNRITADMIFRF